MGKTKTSKKQKKYTENTPNIQLKKNMGLKKYSPTKELLDEKFIALAVWECLKNNDPEGVVEIISYHLDTVNKFHATKNTDLPRSTFYNAIKGKNPTVKTLAKLVNCCAA